MFILYHCDFGLFFVLSVEAFKEINSIQLFVKFNNRKKNMDELEKRFPNF